jgi:hypothetical protein
MWTMMVNVSYSLSEANWDLSEASTFLSFSFCGAED